METEFLHPPISTGEERDTPAIQSRELPLLQAAKLEELLSTLAEWMFVPLLDQPVTGLSINQLRTCSILQHGPQTVSDIARELSVSLGSTSQIVERMVQVGIVERYESRDDRRFRFIKLTERGSAIMECCKEYRKGRAEIMLSKVHAPQRKAILRALRSLFEAATTVSPFHADSDAEPGCASNLVRASELTPEKYIEDVTENFDSVPEKSALG